MDGAVKADDSLSLGQRVRLGPVGRAPITAWERDGRNLWAECGPPAHGRKEGDAARGRQEEGRKEGWSWVGGKWKRMLNHTQKL